MEVVNRSSILSKAEACMKTPEKKNEIKKVVDAYMLSGNKSGSSANTIAAADRFVEVLKKCIRDSAGTNYSAGELSQYAIDAVSNIKRGKVSARGNGSYSVEINFGGERHRDSLAPSLYPEGVDDIVVILNNGYPEDGHQMGVVSGTWHGNHTFSLPNRNGAHFIEDAVSVFMTTEAAKFGVIDIQVNI